MSPTPRDVVTESTPALIGALATQLTSAVPVATTGLAGLSTAAIFLAPLVLPGLISRLFPADPVSIFGGSENVLPFGVDLSIFGGPFAGRTNPFRPKLRFENPFSGQRRIDLPRFTQLAIAAAAEFSFTPEQAELGSEFLEDIPAEPVQLPRRLPFFFTSPQDLLKSLERNSEEKRVSDIARVRREQRERVFTEPVYKAIVSAVAAGLIPGAVPSPKYLEAIGISIPVATTAAPPVAVGVMHAPTRVEQQRQQPAVQLVLIDEVGERHTLLQAPFNRR